MPGLIKTFNKIALLLNLIIYSSIIVAKQQLIDPRYGNGQSKSFMSAIYGNSADVTEDELQEIERSIPPRITQRFFIRAGANKGSSIISKMTNTAVETATKHAKIANGNFKSSAKLGAELALGYRWDRISTELEVLITENIKFTKNPLFSNQPGKLDSIVKAQASFLNVYYDFLDLMPFRAFLGIGVGAGINRTNSNFSNASPISTGINFTRRRIAAAYNLVIGGKINLASRLFINGAFRYTNFAGFGNIKTISTSNVEWRDEAQNLHLEGQHCLYGFSISITHVFL